ncbi:MAG: CoA-binding protein [Desulfomonilia bacterium]|nr:CoA-binding protein [Desulfomonilia bacterium]
MMDTFFYPDGIAVIGATDDPGKGGHYLLNNIISGYRGEIFPVNPKYTALSGLPCYPDVASIPRPFDLAVYFIPAQYLPQTIDACAEKHVKGIIIESAGFSEVGEVGRRLQEESVSKAKMSGIRLWGPNCMGLIDARKRHVFSFMYTDSWKTLLKPGNVSMIVQSGMLSAGFLLMILERGGLGINKLCSIGNKCDVHETELLEYLVCDDDTGVIGLYLESIVDSRAFLKIASSSHKPIILLKGGRSPEGARAAMSHTASMAGNHAILASAMRQAGIIEVFDVHELMDFLRGFSKTPSFSHDGGTAIVTFSGAGGILTTDALHESNLRLARLSEQTLDAMKSVYPKWMAPSNPADVWPAIEANGINTVFHAVTEALMHDPDVDSLIFHILANWVDSSLFSSLNRLKNELGKPVVAWLTGNGERFHVIRRDLEEMGIPVFDEMTRGVHFLRGLRRHFSRKDSR